MSPGLFLTMHTNDKMLLLTLGMEVIYYIDYQLFGVLTLIYSYYNNLNFQTQILIAPNQRNPLLSKGGYSQLQKSKIQSLASST